jgi:hypothetical protein
MTAPTTTPTPSADSEQPGDTRFSSLWSQLFGGAAVQVYFADSELNARVYTLDAESGYKVQHKKIGGRFPVDERDDESSKRLAFPKKARKGESHGRAELTQGDVVAIRAWAAECSEKGRTPPWTAKARELNVSDGTLRDIVARRTWRHIP